VLLLVALAVDKIEARAAIQIIALVAPTAGWFIALNA
jgi:hypothetical protein